MTFSPIALFVYTRLDTLREVVANLTLCAEAKDTDLYVFSDEGKDEKSRSAVRKVRSFLRTIQGFRSVRIVERESNCRLEYNVIRGVGQVLGEHDRVIVMEDDLVPAPYCLKFLNEALEMYRNEKKVMSLSGFTNICVPGKGDSYFTPHMTGYGCWGTWKDRWEGNFIHFTCAEQALSLLSVEEIDRLEYGGNFPCLKSLYKDPVPWDICWSIAIVKAGGLCLNPTVPLVRNIGLRRGTHFDFRNSRIFGRYVYDRKPSMLPVRLEKHPVREDPEIEKELAAALRDHGFRYNLLGKAARAVLRIVGSKTTSRP